MDELKTAGSCSAAAERPGLSPPSYYQTLLVSVNILQSVRSDSIKLRKTLFIRGQQCGVYCPGRSAQSSSSSLCSDSSLSKTSPCSEAGKPCNPCLDAAKACNLNETCKRLRSAYNSICSKATPPQPSLANQEPCSRKRCQKVGARSYLRVSAPNWF